MMKWLKKIIEFLTGGSKVADKIKTEDKAPEWALALPWVIIRVHADKYGLDPKLIAAIIQVESAGNTYAIRYEKKWSYYFKVPEYAQKIRSSEDTEGTGQATSWGLMQVMGTVAREHGFEGWFPELCDPNKGIFYGCAHLDSKLSKYRKMDDAIAAYNAGSPIKKVDETYVNQYYVDKVMDYYSQL